MRLAIGGLWHETHTFVNTRTTLDDFRAYQFARGDDLCAKYEGTRTEVGGCIAGAHANGATVAPLLYAGAVPSGLVTREAYEWLRAELLAQLEEAGAVDGIVLALHGAMVAEGVDDVEGDLLQAVRERVGTSRPIVITLDNHANIGARVFENANAVIPYDTYPHVDMFERGVEAVTLIHRMIVERIQPQCAWRKLPLLTAPQAQTTDAEPMKDLMRAVREIESEPGMLTAGIAFGYPYADIERVGMTVSVYAEQNVELAQSFADDLAARAWDKRHGFVIHENVPPSLAVSQAISAAEGPIILVDVADNIGGGTPGDGTVLLAELLAQHAQSAVVTIADPEAVDKAIEAGVRSEAELEVGGKQDKWHGPPVRVRGKVRLIAEGRYVHRGTYMKGQTTDMGRTVVVECDGVLLVLMERKAMPFDAEQLRSLAIEPAAQHIIVVKSAIAWKAAYGDLARRVIYTDTPGLCSSHLQSFRYQKVPRPIFPLDAI